MLVEILFWVFASILVGIGAGHDHGEEPGARGHAAGAVLLHQRLHLAAHRGGVPRRRADPRLRRRRHGAVPVRGHDARHQHRRSARARHALCAARRHRRGRGGVPDRERRVDAQPGDRCHHGRAAAAGQVQQHRRARQSAVHRLRVSLRARRRAAAHRHRRRHLADHAQARRASSCRTSASRSPCAPGSRAHREGGSRRGRKLRRRRTEEKTP